MLVKTNSQVDVPRHSCQACGARISNPLHHSCSGLQRRVTQRVVVVLDITTRPAREVTRGDIESWLNGCWCPPLLVVEVVEVTTQ